MGWPVYDSAGRLGFTDCNGRSQALAGDGGGLKAAARKCPGRPAPFQLAGRVRSVEPALSRLTLEVDGGGRRVLYLGPDAAAAVGTLSPGTLVEVEGPVDGHAATARGRS